MNHRNEVGTPFMPVSIACAGCGKVHELPNREAARQLWCDGCGALIEPPAGVQRSAKALATVETPRAATPLPGSLLREFGRKPPRPISVHVALVAGGLASFVELLAALSWGAAWGGRFLAPRMILYPWWILLLLWLGLVRGSPRAARIARVGGLIAPFIMGHFALTEQIALWGASPSWSLLFWGIVRVMLRSLPLLVMAAALGSRSARDYYFSASVE